jgi:hypothetical protein
MMCTNVFHTVFIWKLLYDEKPLPVVAGCIPAVGIFINTTVGSRSLCNQDTPCLLIKNVFSMLM